ncbi:MULTISPECIES: hypothetical protein [unclassified Anabaena]|uniref:hypothetical protein n=1 Tax=unclassified Anabaena TaxID=2619674 RepID=UPI0039C6232A
MDEQEERLRQLIAAACQHPDGTKEWRKAMNRLLIVIQGLPEFRKYSGLDCPDYFLDALNQTWEWLSRNIRNFQPRTSSIRTDLMKWLNTYLYWRLKDLKTPSSLTGKIKYLSLDETISDSDSVEIATWLERVSQEGQLLGTPSNPRVLSGLEIYLEQQQQQSEQNIVTSLALYIEQDPDKQLRNCYPRQHPECNCQLLSQRLLFIFKNPPDKLADIAHERKINYQTLVSHWKLKGIPLLQSIAIKLGYQPN